MMEDPRRKRTTEELEEIAARERKSAAKERERFAKAQLELHAVKKQLSEVERSAREERKHLERLRADLRGLLSSNAWKIGQVVKRVSRPDRTLKEAAAWAQSKRPEVKRIAKQVLAPTPAPAPAPSSSRIDFDLERDEEMEQRYQDALHKRGFSAATKRICFAVYTVNLDEGRGDVFVAVGLGRYMERLGWDVVYLPRELWSAPPLDCDVFVAMLPMVPIEHLEDQTTRIAWIRNETDAWRHRKDLSAFDGILCSSEPSRRLVSQIYPGRTGILPIGFDHELFNRGSERSERRGVVSTVNQWGREREIYGALKAMTIDFPLAIYGVTRAFPDSLRPHTKGLVSYFELPSLYRQAKVVLDDLNHTTLAYGNINSRTYEAMACGAKLISNSLVGHRAQEIDGVSTYSSPSDLRSAIQRHLRDEESEGMEAYPPQLEPHSFAARAQTFDRFLRTLPERVPVRSVVGFYPDYRAGNPYMNMLFSELPGRGFYTIALGDLEGDLESLWRHTSSPVLSLHWTAPILGPALSEDDAHHRRASMIASIERFQAKGGRVVWTLHNAMPHETRFPAIEAELRQAIADRADAIHIMNPETRDAVKPYFSLPDSKCVVIQHSSYLGIYPNVISRDAARYELRLEESDEVFLFLGGIRPYKNLDLLLDVFESASDLHPNWRLLVAGRPGRFPELPQLNDRCLANPKVISSFNSVADDELQVYFNAADVVVLPYSRGLNSGALNLAWSFGRPVVAPDIAGFAASTHDRAVFPFEVGKPGSLLDAMERSLEAPRDEREAAARSEAQLRPVRAMANAYADVVEGLL